MPVGKDCNRLFKSESGDDLRCRDAGDWELVEYTARQMLDHDSAYGGAHYLLGLVAEHKGSAAEAEGHFAEAKSTGHPPISICRSCSAALLRRAAARY